MAFLRLNSSNGAWLINLDRVLAVHRAAVESDSVEQVTFFVDSPILDPSAPDHYEIGFIGNDATEIALALGLELDRSPEAAVLQELPESDTGAYEYDGDDTDDDAEEGTP